LAVPSATRDERRSFLELHHRLARVLCFERSPRGSAGSPLRISLPAYETTAPSACPSGRTMWRNASS